MAIIGFICRHIPLLRRPFWQRDQARMQCDVALDERDKAIIQRDQAIAALEQAIAAHDSSKDERSRAMTVWNMALSGSGHPAFHRDKPELSVDAKLNVLRHKPWYSVYLPPQIEMITSMIHADERRLLYVLARDYFTGTGRIIDGGAYLGASAKALAFGLRDRGFERRKVIDSFDTFIIDEQSVVNNLLPGDDPDHKISAGSSTRAIYDRNISEVSDYIEVHEGNLMLIPWTGGPVEILFSDVAKSWRLNDYILSNWISALLPGTGVLIQQDQVQEYHVWVAITMEMLDDYFEFIDYTPFSSAVFRLRQTIPRPILDKCLFKNISIADMEYYYTRFVERFRRLNMGRFSGWNLGMVEAGLAVTLGFHIGDVEKAFHVLGQCERSFGAIDAMATRLAVIRQHLETRTPCPGSILYH
jgi:hypothetical protein